MYLRCSFSYLTDTMVPFSKKRFRLPGLLFLLVLTDCQPTKRTDQVALATYPAETW